MDRLDAVELLARRRAMEGGEGCELARAALESVELARRERLLHDGAVEQCERMRCSFLDAARWLSRAIELIKFAKLYVGDEQWHTEAQKIERAWSPSNPAQVET